MLISAEGRSYRAVVADQILLQGFRQNKTYENKIVVQIQAYRPDERKRDLDNLLKAPLDALAKAGVYKDDSQIVDLRIFWAKEKGGMLKILISEVNDAHSD
jgi:crossover junction endodeoxyribonuclease RusA